LVVFGPHLRSLYLGILLLLRKFLVVTTKTMQTIYILEATFMNYPKTMMDPMLGPEAEAGKIVEASKSP
jgi:hypothetical protein